MSSLIEFSACSQKIVCRSYVLEVAGKLRLDLERIMSKAGIECDSEKLFEQLEVVFVRNLYTHYLRLLGMSRDVEKGFKFIGKSFINCDLRAGTVCLITAVRRNPESKWYHLVVSAYCVKKQMVCPTFPHGWTEEGSDILLGRKWVDLYWSHNGICENKHSYVSSVGDNVCAMISPGGACVLVPIDSMWVLGVMVPLFVPGIIFTEAITEGGMKHRSYRNKPAAKYEDQ